MSKEIKKKSSKKKGSPAKKGTEVSVDLSAQLDALASDRDRIQNEVLDLKKQCDELTGAVDDAKDQALRSRAELENAKRRMAQEKSSAITFANTQFIKDLLPMVDSFELAMQQVKSVENSDVAALSTGVEMIQKQLQQFLDKAGVTRIDAMGQPFDPTLHQGVSQESHPDKDEHTIVKEMQPGYMLNGRVIRASMVVVSTK